MDSAVSAANGCRLFELPGHRWYLPQCNFYIREVKEILIQVHFVQAREKVRAFLARYDGQVPDGQIEIDETLDESALAVHRYPDTVVVRSADVPESVIAHELVHVAQHTLEQFGGFHLLYVLLAEGLAEFVARSLYPAHVVKYAPGYEAISLLVEVVPGAIGDLVRINDLPLTPADAEGILTSSCLPPYTRRLLAKESDLIRSSVEQAWEAGIGDPTFVTLGEELRAWKFLLDERFGAIWSQLYAAIEPWFEVEGERGDPVDGSTYGSGLQGA